MNKTDLSAHLTREVVDKFQNDGAVVLRGIFSQYWIDTVRRGIEFNLQNPSKYAQWLKTSQSTGVYFNDYCNSSKIPEFQEYIKNSPAAAIAAALTQSEKIRFYHEHVLDKSPGSDRQTPWHQDQPYYPIDGNKVCSIWMPVDSIQYESSLQLIRGSHKWGRRFKPRMFATFQDYEGNSSEEDQYESLDIDEMNKYPVLQWAVEPGDCVVFHLLTVHGAAGNKSISRRRVLATRWLGDDVCLTTRPWKVSPPLESVFQNPSKPSLDELIVIPTLEISL